MKKQRVVILPIQFQILENWSAALSSVLISIRNNSKVSIIQVTWDRLVYRWEDCDTEKSTYAYLYARDSISYIKRIKFKFTLYKDSNLN